jgi:hypothetical protein
LPHESGGHPILDPLFPIQLNYKSGGHPILSQSGLTCNYNRVAIQFSNQYHACIKNHIPHRCQPCFNTIVKNQVATWFSIHVLWIGLKIKWPPDFGPNAFYMHQKLDAKCFLSPRVWCYKKKRVDYRPWSLSKVLGTYVGTDPNYPQTYLEIWLLHSKVIAWGTCLHIKDDKSISVHVHEDKKQQLCEKHISLWEASMWRGRINGVTTCWWPQRLAKILCDTKLLSNDLKFSKNLKVGFSVIHIGELNGKNISATFNEVFNQLRLRIKK